VTTRVIPIRADEDDDLGGYRYRMCPTCQHQEGGALCDACDNGDEYEIHEVIEEEFF
jgi:hypothetical protein